MFNEESAYRRKSSLVPAENSASASRDTSHYQNTPCFVHQRLEKQRKLIQEQLPAVVDSNESQNLDNDVVGDGKEIHSRLLTKKQLADMAMGVRELSKQLGSVRLKIRVKTVFLLVKAYDGSLVGLARELVDWLLSTERDTPYIVCGL